jgi:hypothetical protein
VKKAVTILNDLSNPPEGVMHRPYGNPEGLRDFNRFCPDLRSRSDPGRPEVTITTREKTIGTILDASFDRSEDLMNGTVR